MIKKINPTHMYKNYFSENIKNMYIASINIYQMLRFLGKIKYEISFSSGRMKNLKKTKIFLRCTLDIRYKSYFVDNFAKLT